MNGTSFEGHVATGEDRRLSFPDNLQDYSPQEQVEAVMGNYDFAAMAAGTSLLIVHDEELSLSARLLGLEHLLEHESTSSETQEARHRYQAFRQAHAGMRHGVRHAFDPEQGLATPVGVTEVVTKDEAHTWFDYDMPLGRVDSRGGHTSIPLLNRAEGVNFDAYLDPIEGDHMYGYDHTPHDAAALLRQVHRYAAKGGGQYQELIADLVPLAEDYYFTIAAEAVRRGDWLGLAEIVIGPDIDRPIMDLASRRLVPGANTVERRDMLRSINGEMAVQIEKLFNASLKVAELFTPAPPRVVADAFLRATLTSVYGIAQHEQNEAETVDALDLSEDYSLPVRLKGGNEPVELIDELIAAIDKMYALKTGKDTLVTPGPRSEDYLTYRHNTLSPEGVTGSLLEYIRPLTGARGDQAYEYGKSSTGIKASHDFRYTKADFLARGKADQGQDGLSIRMDLDEDGDNLVLSLDVGSILGRDGNLGVRIGRFLAWSNQLRARQVLEERPMFNHSSEVFPHTTEGEVAALFRSVIHEREQDVRLTRAPRLARLLDAAGINYQASTSRYAPTLLH